MACCLAARSRTCKRWSKPSAKVSPPLPDRTGILCMAYGSPDGEGGIEPYYTHIRGGRPPSAESLAELRARYRAIGGSPLTEITRAPPRTLAERLHTPPFSGRKHPPPLLAHPVA